MSTAPGALPPTVDQATLKFFNASNGSGGACVDVAFVPEPTGGVAVRHSRDPQSTVIHYTPAEWDAFVAGAKAGKFDRPTA